MSMRCVGRSSASSSPLLCLNSSRRLVRGRTASNDPQRLGQRPWAGRRPGARVPTSTRTTHTRPTGTLRRQAARRRSSHMSPHLHHEIARARQREIAASTVNAHHAREVRRTSGPRRRVIQHFGRAVAALGVCLAIPIAVTVDGALASPGSVKSGGRVSAQRYAARFARSRRRATRRRRAQSTGR